MKNSSIKSLIAKIDAYQNEVEKARLLTEYPEWIIEKVRLLEKVQKYVAFAADGSAVQYDAFAEAVKLRHIITQMIMRNFGLKREKYDAIVGRQCFLGLRLFLAFSFSRRDAFFSG